MKRPLDKRRRSDRHCLEEQREGSCEGSSSDGAATSESPVRHSVRFAAED